MPSYEVAPGNSLQHDGEQYTGGDKVDLEEEQAAPLVQDRILLPAGGGDKVAEAERKVADLERELEEKRTELNQARNEAYAARDNAVTEAEDEEGTGANTPVAARGRGKERAEATS